MVLNKDKQNDVKYLSRIFSSSLIKKSFKNNDHSSIQSIVVEAGFEELLSKTLMYNLYGDAFKLLSKYYRNEYIYKSAIIEQLL